MPDSTILNHSHFFHGSRVLNSANQYLYRILLSLSLNYFESLLNPTIIRNKLTRITTGSEHVLLTPVTHDKHFTDQTLHDMHVLTLPKLLTLLPTEITRNNNRLKINIIL